MKDAINFDRWCSTFENYNIDNKCREQHWTHKNNRKLNSFEWMVMQWKWKQMILRVVSEIKWVQENTGTWKEF